QGKHFKYAKHFVSLLQTLKKDKKLINYIDKKKCLALKDDYIDDLGLNLLIDRKLSIKYNESKKNFIVFTKNEQKTFKVSELEELCKYVRKTLNKIYSTKLKAVACTADTLSRTEVDYRDSFIEEWFDEFNRRYFHNKLKDINVSWSSSMEYSGCFKYNVDVFAKTIYPIEIELNKKNINSFDSFRNVLVHEMLHYYVDCYVNKPTDEQWMEAVKLKMTKGETEDYLNALDLGTDKCHLCNWQRLANELNSNHKELNITAFGDRDIGLNNSKVDYNNIHLILIKYKNSDTGENVEKFKTYNKERLDEIKKQIKEYKNKPISPREFYFYEIELDRKKLSTSGITELFGNETFNDNFLAYLRKSGVVTKDVTFLGKSNAYKRFSTV
ncbi:MAG: SprT-like domain-containing protein, partial [Bacilli bacterium]|nr:SprT-like domain-containing protein [Bacilli bacterium]